LGLLQHNFGDQNFVNIKWWLTPGHVMTAMRRIIVQYTLLKTVNFSGGHDSIRVTLTYD
jgi:hypothetical protein